MPDFRVADTAPEHPKLRAAGLAAAGLWSMAGAWAMRELTDGFVPKYWVTTWPGGPRSAAKLVEVGLWYPAERAGLPGWRYHDWLDFQRAAAKIHDERAEARERARKRRSSAKSSGERSPEQLPDVRAESHDSRALTRALTPGGSNHGGRPVSDARKSRNTLPRCENHRLWPPDQPIPPCGPCKQLRLAAEAQVADQQQRTVDDEVRRRRMIADCPDCDDRGMRELPDERVTRCTHPKLTDQTQDAAS